MKIYCLGDSLTEGDYGVYKKRCIANVQKENYPYFLSKLTNANVVNLGRCGYQATNYYNDFCITQKTDLSDADYILIMLGTNGGYEKEQRVENFKAYDKIIDYCEISAPKAKIVLITPPFRSLNPENSNAVKIDYLKDVRDCVIKSAEKYHLPIIDLYSFKEFCEENVPIYQTNDGLHFVEKGYQVLAKFVYDNLVNYFPEDFGSIIDLIEGKINTNQKLLIMAVGDSITYGMNHCTADQTYCAELCKLFAEKYPDTKVVRYDGIPSGELNPLKEYDRPITVNEGEKGEIAVVKSGVGGNTVRRALNRSDDFTGEFIGSQMPDVFLLMFGINDALDNDKSKFVTPDVFYSDYTELYNLLKATNPNAKIVFMTPTYNDTGLYEVSGLEPYCDMVKRLARQNNCKLIDTHSLWMDHLIVGSEHYGQRDWLSDRVGDSCHFSPKGSKATANFIFDELLK